MPNYFGQELFSVGMATQTAYDVPDGAPSWTWLISELPTFNLAREMSELALSLPSDMVMRPKAVGSRHGSTMTLKAPLEGQLTTYDPSSGDPVSTPVITLLKEIIGTSTTGTFAAADITAASTANVWKTTASSLAEGSCYLTGSSVGAGSAILGSGWCTDSAGAGGDQTMFEDSPAIPASGEDIVQTMTLYPDGSQPSARTFRLTGVNAEHDLWVIGCIPEGATITLDAAAEPSVEFTYRFTDWAYKAAGGLQSATEYQRIAPILGAEAGRVWLDGATLSDGTAETTGTCGLGSLQIVIGCDLTDIPCHSAEQGVTDVTIRRRNVTVTFTIPYQSAYVTGEESDWDTSLEDGTTKSLSIQVGDTVGQFMGLLIPAGIVSEQAQIGPQDNIIAWSVTMAPGAYAGDTGAVTAANSPFRIAFG